VAQDLAVSRSLVRRRQRRISRSRRGIRRSPGRILRPVAARRGAAPQQDAQRTWDLVARLAQLQGQLATHWSEIASSAARRFVARVARPRAVRRRSTTL